jgi:hypothetical protein
MSPDKKTEWKSIVILGILYFFAYVLMLTGRGFISDSLHLITIVDDKNYYLLWPYLGQFHSYVLYYITLFLILLGGDVTFLLKVSGFFVWFAGGTALYFLLKRIIKLSNNDSFFLSASFLLFVTTPYLKGDFYIAFSVGSTLFFIAMLIYFSAQKYVKKMRRYLGQIVALILFIFSFSNNAILVFYFGFLLLHFYLYWRDRRNESLRYLVISWVRTNFLIILLPFVYWIWAQSLGKPYGELGNHYNDITLFVSSGWPRMLLDDVWSYVVYGFGWPILGALAMLERRIFAGIFLLMVPVVYFLTRHIFLKKEKEISLGSKVVETKAVHFLLAGIAWFALGAFPYITVHKFTSIYGENTMRYGVLLPLGASLIILGLVKAFFKEGFQNTIKVLVLTLFIVFNMYNFWRVDMDHYRQVAIVDAIRNTESSAIHEAGTLIFHDEYPDLIYMGRIIKTSELTEYLHQALYPNDFKFGFAPFDIGPGRTLDAAIIDNYGRYKRTGIFPHPEQFDPLAEKLDVAIVSHAPYETMTVGMWLKLKKYELFSDDLVFHKKLKDELQVDVVPVAPRAFIEEKNSPK